MGGRGRGHRSVLRYPAGVASWRKARCLGVDLEELHWTEYRPGHLGPRPRRRHRPGGFLGKERPPVYPWALGSVPEGGFEASMTLVTSLSLSLPYSLFSEAQRADKSLDISTLRRSRRFLFLIV